MKNRSKNRSKNRLKKWMHYILTTPAVLVLVLYLYAVTWVWVKAGYAVVEEYTRTRQEDVCLASGACRAVFREGADHSHTRVVFFPTDEAQGVRP